jgi:hypothetical protein
MPNADDVGVKTIGEVEANRHPVGIRIGAWEAKAILSRLKISSLRE